MSWRAIGDSFFGGCADFAQRRAWLTLFICLVLTALAGYSASQLRISTETEDIFAADLEFLRNERAYLEAFPRGVLPIIAVVDAPTAGRAQAAARALADRLSENRLFRQIAIPGAEPYFRENALLFLSLEEIRGIEQRLRTAGPALQVLVREPNFGGIPNSWV